MSEMKTCRKCGALLPLAEFYRHPNTGDGLFGSCRECVRVAGRERRAANPPLPRQRAGWRDIRTVHRNPAGLNFLVYHPATKNTHLVHFAGGELRGDACGPRYSVQEMSHWRPLPKPPPADAAER